VEIRVSPPRVLFLGRSEECDIFLGEKKISRKHCRIEVNGEEVKLEDLQTRTGPTSRQEAGTLDLGHEDKIRVGTSVIQVSISSEASVAEASMVGGGVDEKISTGTVKEPPPSSKSP